MKVIVIGAGELGILLSEQLTDAGHDVVILDNSAEKLADAGKKLDVLTVEGNCASVVDLKKAGAEHADALLAVSGNEPANIVACALASKLGVPTAICRLYGTETFSEKDGIVPGTFGIGRTFSPQVECAEKIGAILENDILLERIRFSYENAEMAVVEITQSSDIAGAAIKNIPFMELKNLVCFAAILRNNKLIVPHGDTIFAPGDKVYVSGTKDGIDYFLNWLNPHKLKLNRRLVVNGSDDTSLILARQAVRKGYEVRFIEPDEKRSELLPDELPGSVLIFNGDPTSEDMQKEAGVDCADVFVSASANDENNILSCIMAKRMGARKVICLTHKPEYIAIVPSMSMIDCSLSATLVSVNTVLRYLEAGTRRVDAILQRVKARLSEFRISRNSPICGKKLMDCRLPQSLVIALIIRGREVLIPGGSTQLEENDTVLAIITQEDIRDIEKLFPIR